MLSVSGFMYLTPTQAILLNVTTGSDAEAVGWSRGLRQQMMGCWDRVAPGASRDVVAKQKTLVDGWQSSLHEGVLLLLTVHHLNTPRR